MKRVKMSRFLAPCALMITLLSGSGWNHPAMAQGMTAGVLQGLPAGFVLDGKVAEWSSPPTFILDKNSQVAGKRKIADNQDFSAKIWLAFHSDGVTLAGQVTDNRVMFPTGQDGAALLNSDHVEFWLSSPAAELPAMGFGNQFDFNPVDSQDWCQKNKDSEMAFEENFLSECKSWVKKQIHRRNLLPRLFTRQYVITPEGISEHFARAAQEVLPKKLAAEVTPCCDEGKSRFVRRDDGYSFESFIPWSHFPATRQAPMGQWRFLVDVVDNDRDQTTMESFLSSSKERKFGNPATFNVAQLSETLLPTGLWLKGILAGKKDLFYFPGSPIQRIYGFKNLHQGYQYTPSQESPVLIALDLPEAPVATHGSLEIYWVGQDVDEINYVDSTYYTVRNDQVVGRYTTRNNCFNTSVEDNTPVDADSLLKEEDEAETSSTGMTMFTHTEGKRLLLATLCEGTMSPLGTGMCGGCPQLAIEVLAIDESGEIKPLLQDTLGSLSGDAFTIALSTDQTAIEICGPIRSQANLPVRTTLFWSELARKTAKVEKSETTSLQDEGKTPLIQMVLEEDAAQLKQALAKGAPVNATDGTGYTPLMWAVAMNNEEIIKLLLQHGAQVNVQDQGCLDQGGTTPLMLAVESGSVPITKMLLAKGADRRIKNKKGETALSLAQNNKEILQLLQGK